MKKWLIAIVLIQLGVNLYYIQKSNTPVPQVQVKKTPAKKLPVRKTLPKEKASNQEIYVYTLEIDEDLRELTQEVMALKKELEEVTRSRQEFSQQAAEEEDPNALFNQDIFESIVTLNKEITDSGQDANEGVPLDRLAFSKDQLAFMDLDANGEITQVELQKIMSFRVSAVGVARRRDLQDGTFPTRQEYYAGELKKFQEIDMDNDGEMTLDEYMHYRKKGYTAWQAKKNKSTK